ncbi:MAG: glycoside hydrolase family 2 [Armatimonadetes bacterium]|nr:glycoside hydrolase family 2 [Armatimonadota bacterium]
MRTVDLNGIWDLWLAPTNGQLGEQLEPPADAVQVACRVPGNVELDLLDAGLLPAPLEKGNNIYAAQDYEHHAFWYRRTFATPQTKPDEQIVLCFGGVDCIATVFLNGQAIARPRNMLVPLRVDITGLVAEGGENTLTVHIEPAVDYGDMSAVPAHCWAMATNWESLRIRKAPHMYGWDILPRLVSAGLWRDVCLEIWPPTRFESVYFTTAGVDVDGRSARLVAQWQVVSHGRPLAGTRLRLTLSRDGEVKLRQEQTLQGSHGRLIAHVSDAALWWPRGWGEAALYDATLTLLDAGGRVLAMHEQRIGLRTVELRRTEVTDAQGSGEFLFVVNGRPLFAKGTNWVPLDSLHSRDGEHLPGAMAMLAELNCNMVRCWGGNVYESDAFFDACDELGILVWQDFAFACAVYPQDQWFLSRCEEEAEAVVHRLRNHPSLALWAGNNEIDDCMYAGWGGFRIDPNGDPLSREVLPSVVRQLDPARPYLPSSPYVGPELVASGYPEAKPEEHLWGPRDDFKGSFYMGSAAHFVSEIGYHGCPARASLEAMMDADHLWPWQDNDQWLTHAVRPKPGVDSYDYRIPLMGKQAAVLFHTVPEDLDDYILASQASQAEALKFFLERWRGGERQGGKFRRTGMLWWNLRDGWPVISDAIVDYYGRRKLAYEVVRRCQADVLVLCGEPDGGRHEVVAVNDTLRPRAGHVVITDLDSGAELFGAAFELPPNGRVHLGWLAESAAPGMWEIKWTADGEAGHNHYLAGPRPFVLAEYRRWADALGLLAVTTQ